MKSVANEAGSARTGESLRAAVVIDTEQVHGHLDEVVRSTVETTLNQVLDEEADWIAGAGKSQRSSKRQDTRAECYRLELLANVLS